MIVVIFGSVLSSDSPSDIDVAYSGCSRERAIALANSWTQLYLPVDAHECEVRPGYGPLVDGRRESLPAGIHIPAIDASDPHVVIAGDMPVYHDVADTVTARIRRAIRAGLPLTEMGGIWNHPFGFRLEVATSDHPETMRTYTGCDIRALRRALAKREGAAEEFIALFTGTARDILRQLLAQSPSDEVIARLSPQSATGPRRMDLVFGADGTVAQTHGGPLSMGDLWPGAGRTGSEIEGGDLVSRAASMSIRRFVLGPDDFEMAAIRALISECCPGIPVVDAAAGGRTRPLASYASDVVPEAGDVWIEASPYTGLGAGKQGVADAGGVVIDHHFPGDPGFGRPLAEAFAASSIGQVVALLGEHGLLPAWPDDGEPGMIDHDGGMDVVCGGRLRRIPAALVAIGEADHSLAAFVRGACSTPREEARARVLDRLSPEVRALIPEAIEAIASAPTVYAAGSPAVADLRRLPDLAQGGRLGQAAFTAALLMGVPYVSWGMQGVTPQGRHLGFGGAGEGSASGAFDFRPLLVALGGVGIYGDPARGVGGCYVPT